MFGSFARGEARRDSDVDVVAVRDPAAVSGGVEDDLWVASVGRWVGAARSITGNPVNLIDLDLSELRPAGRKAPSWLRDASKDGVVIAGSPLPDLIDSQKGHRTAHARSALDEHRAGDPRRRDRQRRQGARVPRSGRGRPRPRQPHRHGGQRLHATIAIRAASQAVAAADRVDLEAMHVAGSLDVSTVADVLTRFLGADDDRIERLHSLERI